MTYEFTPELRSHMERKGIHGIIVQVASCDHTDLQVTELHIHFVSQRQGDSFVKRRRFTRKDLGWCSLYFPPYRLEYGDTLRFDLRRVGPFAFVRCTDISL